MNSGKLVPNAIKVKPMTYLETPNDKAAILPYLIINSALKYINKVPQKNWKKSIIVLSSLIYDYIYSHKYFLKSYQKNLQNYLTYSEKLFF